MAARPTFRDEFADFRRFLMHPSLRRLPQTGTRQGGVAGDWKPSIGFGRLMAWAGVLWAINLFALGPIAMVAAKSGGAVHRLDPYNIPWLMAVLWAPVVEELLFRYGLRRPAQALWLCPAMLPPLLFGPQGWTLAWLGCVLLLLWRCARARPAGTPMAWRREYVFRYGLVFHLTALAFAAVHLNNFNLQGTALYLLPLLVLPQWVTGLVLGWMRTRRGIGASMLLHAVFNGGPVLLILVLMGLLKVLPVPS